MGLLQKAVETYDTHAGMAGAVQAGHQPLAPVSHIVTGANIEITLDAQGHLMDAVVVGKEDTKIIIPATERSAGRTNAPCAHPLCEQVGYLSGQDEKKYQLYIEQLQAWESSAFSHPMLRPILTYVRGRTLLDDLAAHNVKLKKDQLIRWRVVGIGADSGPCWTSQSLFQSFIDWYESVRMQSDDAETLCMISGNSVIPAKQHPGRIIPMKGLARLLSSNDSSNFTYRGRFTDDRQAATVGYEASQKAHNALRWLVAEQGARVVFGGRTFLCWNPQGKPVPHSNLPFLTEKSTKVTPTDYREELQRTLEGWRTQLPETCGGVVIAAFDAATKGRLAVTYYNELLASDFLQRLYRWDETCCWWRWNPEHHRYDAVQSPPLWNIVNCAFGTQRAEKGGTRLVTDERIMKQQMQRLVSCRVDQAKFPADMARALVNRASMPQAYDPIVYRNLLSTACAVIRKYHYDLNKEALQMTLEQERADRSYQFGRLLAVLDQAEKDYYWRTGESRQTTVAKSMDVFRRRPLTTYERIHRHLEHAYLSRIAPWQVKRFRALNEEIVHRLAAFSAEELNAPLGDTYLLGYYTQLREFYESNDPKEQEENER